MEWYLDIIYYDYFLPNEQIIFKIILLIFFILILLFVKEVIKKKLWLQAFAQQMSDEISRLDIGSSKQVSEKMQEIIAQFTIDILPSLYEKQSTILMEVPNDAKTLSEIGHSVTQFRESKFKSFLAERKVMRWVFDGLEALIGDNKSIEVAWSKGLRYLNKFAKAEDKDSIPWLPTYMKLLNLPYNYHEPDFNQKVIESNSRTYPKGYYSLWIATRKYNHKKLRYFELRGEEAWEKLLKFKAKKPSDFND